jgi:hypothetical protein
MDRQAAFRAVYRERIEPWYSPLLHVACIYVIGVGILLLCLQHLRNPITLTQWLVALAVFLGANVLEWVMHHYVMHRPHKNAIARAIYRRHTLMHHQFFTKMNYAIDSMRDFRIVFFPPYTEVAAITAATPAALVFAWLFGANAGWLTILVIVVLYMIYESFHLCCHVRENWFVRHMPLVNTIRRHHIAHHEQSIMMRFNMNLTFPIADWLFRTSDLNRGILGTLFNGLSEAHLREDLARAVRTPEIDLSAASGRARCWLPDR